MISPISSNNQTAQTTPYRGVKSLVKALTIKTTIVAASAFIFLTSIKGAYAGPVAYAACMAGCAAMPPICAAGGWAACLTALAAPTP